MSITEPVRIRFEADMSDDMRDILKLGRRNSTADERRMKELRKLLRQADMLIDELGLAGEFSGEDMKAMPLDQLAAAVDVAVYSLNGDYYGTPWKERYSVAAVYTDTVIIRQGLAFWRATYEVGETKIDLQPRSDWELVEPAWTLRSDSEPASGEEVVGEEQKSAPEVVADEEAPEENTETIPEEAKSAPDSEASSPIYSDIKVVAPGRLRHYAVMWGDSQKADLYNEWFTPNTQELDVIFKAIGKLPLLYHHGLDETLKTEVVGVVDEMGTDDVGLWVESQLNMANRYATGIVQMAESGKLGTSSGTLPGARRVKSTGEILRWPIAEISTTPTPAEPRMVLERPVTVLKSAYTELGLPYPDQFAKDKGAEEARQREIEAEKERLAILNLSQ